MARGWESKSVESQIEDRATANAEPVVRGPLPDLESLRKRDGLELSRRRIVRELEASRSPIHRAALESALAHLDGELKKMG